MRVLRVFALGLALAPWGCSDYGIDIAGDEPQGGDDDPGDDDGSPDDDDAPDDDSADLEACDDGALPDIWVDSNEECVLDPADTVWELELSYSVLGADSCDAIHAGTFADTNGDGAIDTADERQIWLDSAYGGMEGFHPDGQLFATALAEANMTHSTVGEVDPSNPGVELLVSFWDGGDDFDMVALVDESGPLWIQQVPADTWTKPWLTDLEGDGQPEVLVGPMIQNALDGSILGTLDGVTLDLVGPAYAADLDLDGTREIIAAQGIWAHKTVLFDADGNQLNVCRDAPVVGGDWDYHSFAIGNLDGDPEGEFLTAGNGFLTLCDSDGSFLAEADVGTSQPSLIGLAELDGDPLPEIVIGDNWGLLAVDDDLTLMWVFEGSQDQGGGWYPFTVADLDGDGYHEILVSLAGSLILLNGAGESLAVVQADQYSCQCWVCAPAVVDIDADGLAEIVVPGWRVFAVIENPNGGWYVEGADAPWPSVDKHPGDRAVDGTLPAPTDVHWSDPLTNVWQGLPAGTSPYLPQPDLAVQSVDVCVDPDDGDEHVFVYVGNYGMMDTFDAVSVTLRSPVDDTLLGQAELPPVLPTSTARAVTFVLPAGATADGLTVVVDEGDSVTECCEDNNSHSWSP